ncbi:MAG TPA: AraC family transcriptional regulator ligand-binding domain-containing protein [bacterium]
MTEVLSDSIALHDQLIRDYASISQERREPVARQLDALWAAAIKRSGDAALSVRLGVLFRPSVSLYTSVLMWSPTVGESLRNLSRYWSPHSTAGKFSAAVLEPVATGARLRYQMADGAGCYAPDAEFRLCRILAFLRNISDASLAPARVTFEHPQPSYRGALEAHFRAPVMFGSAMTALEFDEASLRLPVLATSAQRAGILQLGEQMLAEVPRAGTLADMVRDTIRKQLPSGAFGMRAVAPRVGMSPRTLQRHLQRNETSFQALLDEARKRECLAIMAGELTSNAEIAERLGYSNVANFHRAFRRWFGKTPNQVRRELTTGKSMDEAPPGP